MDLINEKLYTPKEVACILRLTLDTIYLALKDGRLQGFKIIEGGPWRIPQSAVENFCAQPTEKPVESLNIPE